MSAEQLWETTMNPATRVLKQVTIESVAEANKMTELLMGSQVEPRKQYIYNNAKEAVLDI